MHIQHDKMNGRHSREFREQFVKNLVPLKPLDLSQCKTVNDVVTQMNLTAFGGREIGEAANVLEAMTKDKECFKVLTLSGAMTMAKMGLVICDMIENDMVDAVVSTGALMAHGFIEAAGMTHFKNPKNFNDEELYEAGFDRVYDTLESETNLDEGAVILHQVLASMDHNKITCSSEINKELGRYLHKHINGRGILKSAFEKNIPVYIPAFTDSEFGLEFSVYNKKNAAEEKQLLKYDPFIDMTDYTERVLKAKKIGIFTVGGGVPRNWAQQVGPHLDIIRLRVIEPNPALQKDAEKYHKQFSYGVRICPEPVNFGGLCLQGDTKIDMPRNLSIYPDGIPIKNLAGKSNFPVYSYDLNKKRIILANVRGVLETGKKSLYKISYGWVTGWVNKKQELKTNSIIASEDHKFLLRKGVYKKVSELKINDRLMPFNSYYKTDKHGDYRFISLNNGTKLAEHRFILQETAGISIDAKIAVHHKDHNTLNNSLENLEMLNFIEHARYHRFNESKETLEKRAQTLREICDPYIMQRMSRKFWDNLSDEEYERLCNQRKIIALNNGEPERRSKVSKKYWSSLNDVERKIRLQNAHASTAMRWASLSPEMRSIIVSHEKNGRWIKGITEDKVKDALIKDHGVITKTARNLGVSDKVLHKRLKRYTIDKNWIRKNCVENHFIMSIEYYGEEETYDMTVDNTHNFAANGIIVSNSGCTYSEGVSWGKFIPESKGGRYAEVLIDATVALPFVIKAVLERIGKG
ncbi:deoxyhypusine synthase family protein [Candidatus Woesearchaeota archaeon]|nr:deoxyhypusine synthase family protein [Candidatus Woesearchaeota archaeon]